METECMQFQEVICMGDGIIVAFIFLILIVAVYWKPLSAGFQIRALERKYRTEREQLKPMYGVWMICHDEPLGLGDRIDSGPQFAEAMRHLSFGVNSAVAVLDAMEVQSGKKSAEIEMRRSPP